jgi:hypothetical protein
MSTVAETRGKAIAVGRPCQVAETRIGHVAFVHADDESAERSAKANREQYGHPSWVEWRNGIAVSVVDLRPAILELYDMPLSGDA